MQNIDVRFNATSNFGNVKAELAALRAQAASLSAVFEKGAYAKPPELVNTGRWRDASRAVHAASNTYRDAASSSGLLTTQQIRATSEAEKYTKALQKQKLSFGEMRKASGVMKQVYADQLRYQRMTSQSWGGDSAGRAITDITIPKNIPRDLDNVAQRLYFTGKMASSAGTQIVNMGKNMQWAGRQLTVGFTYPLALFGAAAGVMAYKVDKAMTQVTKVYDVSAEAQRSEALKTKELNNVKVRSMEMASVAAKKYGQSIEDTLNVEQALAATGLSGDKLFESTNAVGRIAALGDLDLTASTDMTVALQTAFRKTIKTTDDLNNAFNYMNAVENATSLSIKDIAEAIPRAASAMSALGVSVEETTVLLTSMREAGVNAAEGANALKSATGTILNPSPAAINFIKDIAGDKVAAGIANLADSSGGNLYKAMEQLHELTSGMSNQNEQQILVKLFGKYQFNRVSAMLGNLGDAFDGTQNQARKAMDLMGADTAVLAKSAETELATKMEAVSGRFQAAWQEMRIQLAKVGAPFLEVATSAAKLAGGVLEFFNSMSDGKKRTALIVAAVMAIAGPVVMLGGLFMNLGGQFITGSGKILSAIGKVSGAFTIVTKEEKSAALAAESQNAAMSELTGSASTLAAEIRILAAAYEQATLSAKAYADSEARVDAEMMDTIPAAEAAASAVVANEKEKVVAIRQTMEYQQKQVDLMVIAARKTASNGIYGAFVPPSIVPETAPLRGDNLRAPYQQKVEQAELNRQAAAQTTNNRQMALQQNDLNRRIAIEQQKRNEILKTQEKVKKTVTGTGIAMGAMSVAMAATMISSNKTVDNIAKWAMIGTIAVPAMQGMVSGGNNLVSNMGKSVSKIKLASTGLTGMAGAMAVARAGAVGFGVALNTALGPIGWIALGLTAVVGTFMAIKSHNDKIAAQQKAIVDKQIAATKVMNESTRSIATNLGKAAGSYKQIVGAGVGTAVKGPESRMLNSYEYYKSDEGMTETTALQSDGKLLDTEALMTKISGKFIDLQVLGGDTAEQAKVDAQAMLLAAGASATQAAAMAEEVYRKYGNISNIDWTGPIKDQTDALAKAANEAFYLSTNVVSSGGMAVVLSEFTIDEGKKKLLYEQASKASEIFSQAIGSTADPKKARVLIDQYMNAATSQWQSGFESLMSVEGVDGADKVKALFDKYNIESGTSFANAFRDGSGFKKEYEELAPTVNSGLTATMTYVRDFAAEYEHAFIVPLAQSSYLSDGVMTAATALKQFNDANIGLTSDEATSNLLKTNEAYLQYSTILSQIAELKKNGVADNSQEMLDLQGRLKASGDALLPLVNSLNKQFGFATGKTSVEALNNMLNETAAGTKGAGNEVDGLNNKLSSLPTMKTVTIKVNQVGGIIQSAMGSVQQRMADSAMTQFNSGWDSQIASAQAGYDARSESLAAKQESVSRGMENGQQNAQDAFDARWESRKNTIEKAYQQRIDRVNREIEAEKRSDEIRQQLFEKEKARLQQLADMENTNIDINTALNEGRLDDAAKAMNNAGVSSGNDQMDAEAKAAEARTEAKINALEKKNERLEKAKDKELKNLEKLEEKMRKHLERVQDARRRALESQQADETAALEKSEQATMDSLDTQRGYEESTLQQRLDLFLAYTARNKKDLERWMKELGFKYDDFGDNVGEKGQNWAESVRDSMLKEITTAGTQVMNDDMWEKVGKGVGDKLLRGLGFSGLAEFNKFVKTGQKGGSGNSSKPSGGPDHVQLNNGETLHSGGVVGQGGSGRGNIPNTYKGLHRSEQMVRAQKGEYMINKKSAKANAPILDAINSGTDVGGIGGAGGAGYGSIAGLMAGAAAAMFNKGVGKAFNNNYAVGLKKQKQQKKLERQAAGGTFSGNAGNYGGRSFSAEQMKNAATIASVGSSMGMSTRDIEIGIMTAIAESGLINIHGGDRDSQGLFQQRPSMGWGTVAQVTDPQYAARAFFGPLKAHTERGDESPWLAAQHIQRSAFSDGSNYQAWWAAAQAIFGKGLAKNKGGGYSASGGGFVSGGGGKNAPIRGAVTNGLHGGNTAGNPPAVDMAGPTGRPVYAVSDGVITSSRDIAGPLSTDTYRGDGPYGSFGRVIQMRTNSGADILYGHLSRRSVSAGQQVKGGSTIGYSGNSGNSSGSHLHFGATNGPYAWLRRGGKIKHDNTPVIAHKGETMLSERLTKKFEQSAGGGGGGDTFRVTLDLRGATIKENVDIENAVNKAIDARENKLGRKRVVR